MIHAARFILQQEWIDEGGNREWRDVPMVDDDD
jgi:hypothetical protein